MSDHASIELEETINGVEIAKSFKVQENDDKSLISLVEGFTRFLHKEYSVEVQLEKLKAEFEKTIGKVVKETGQEVISIKLLKGTKTDNIDYFLHGPGLVACFLYLKHLFWSLDMITKTI